MAPEMLLVQTTYENGKALRHDFVKVPEETLIADEALAGCLESGMGTLYPQDGRLVLRAGNGTAVYSLGPLDEHSLWPATLESWTGHA